MYSDFSKLHQALSTSDFLKLGRAKFSLFSIISNSLAKVLDVKEAYVLFSKWSMTIKSSKYPK
jgi:hypothetical protein